MYEVVAANGEAVAVARNLPYGHVGISHLIACRHSGSTSMDSVEAVGIHVVRQTRTTAYTRYHGCAVGRDAESGHGLVEGVEYGVVTATGAPAHGLVTLKIGRGKFCFFHNLVFLHIFSYTVYNFADRERLALNFIYSQDMRVGIAALQVVGKHTSV